MIVPNVWYELECDGGHFFDGVRYPQKFNTHQEAEYVKNHLILIKKKYRKIDIIKITEEPLLLEKQ